MTGPGALLPLADTGLSITAPPADDDRLLMGFGRNGRDGLGLRAVTAAQSCDVVVTDVLLLDPVLGIRRTSIGIRQGRITAVGPAGNPDTTDGIVVVVGTGTVVVPGEGLIATPGAVDPHVHGLSPRVLDAALSSGVTTVITQEFGPFWGVGVGSPWALARGYAAFDAWPVNVGVLGRGSAAQPPLLEALEAGVCGFKVHEDTGAHPRVLDATLRAADAHDVQVCLHTDGLNESMTVADTLAVLDGRTVHAFHVEGCGGGHTPDVLTLAGRPHVLASSTNPSLPLGVDSAAEQLHMIMLSHGMDPTSRHDRQLAGDRVREATMAGENVLHDLGVIPMTSSDALGMGRAGETWRSTFAMASVLKRHQDADTGSSGSGPSMREVGDDARVLRYLAKLTINPALTHGLAEHVGSLQPGRLADIVLWRPSHFAVKPSVVLKSGLPAWGLLGDPNASVDGAQPTRYGRQFLGHGAAPADLSVLFTSAAAADTSSTSTRRRRLAVSGCRTVSATDMLHHGRLGAVTVSSDGRQVHLDDQPLHLPPATTVPLGRLYHL